MRYLVVLLLTAGCATRPPDSVEVQWVRVPAEQIDKFCKDRAGRYATIIGHNRGCSQWNRDAGTCTIWSPDSNEKLGMSAVGDRRQREVMATLGHELKHCFDGPWH